MKILLVSPLPPPNGGIATWTTGYQEYCEQNAVPLSIIDTGIKGSRVKNFAKCNIIDELKRATSIIKNAKKVVKHDQFDVAHFNTSCSTKGMIRDLQVMKVIAKTKIPILLECHCNVKNQLLSKFSKKLFEKIIKKSKKIAVLNSESRNIVQELYKVESDIVPNFIKENSTFKKECSENIKKVLFVGHVLKSKGCDNLISVASRFPEIKFTLVGNISDEIRNIKAPDNVEMIGEVKQKEVKEYMEKSDLFIFPTHSEGFPLVILEAMSVGLPIISTKVGAIGDMLEENDCYFNIGDENGMIEVINKMQSKTVRQNLSDWEINKLNSTYIIDIVMKEIFKLYEEIK